MIEEIKGKKPKIGKNVFIHESAVVIGDVELCDNVSVWPCAVIRGDCEKIIIGENSNIQDGSVLHTGINPLVIGKNVTIGHNVNLHSCIIGDNSLIGIGAIVLDGAVIGNDCLVAAGSLVAPNKSYDDKAMIMGSPAKAVKQLSEEQVAHNRLNCSHYLDCAKEYLKK